MPNKIIRAKCPACKNETQCKKRAGYRKNSDYEYSRGEYISIINDYFILECQGCTTIFFMDIYFDGERDFDGYPETTTTIFPPIDEHHKHSSQNNKKDEQVGNKIFIGHGRSLLWHDLKDFLQDTLKRQYDEFNRISAAGTANTARLADMLDSACFAFLIMTAEDELPSDKKQARMNVVHEVGLFQGRLGFKKAIVLLEDGCEEFSNITGFGQIRFPKENIKACFEEIRDVLEREKIINCS